MFERGRHVDKYVHVLADYVPHFAHPDVAQGVAMTPRAIFHQLHQVTDGPDRIVNARSGQVDRHVSVWGQSDVSRVEQCRQHFCCAAKLDGLTCATAG